MNAKKIIISHYIQSLKLPVLVQVDEFSSEPETSSSPASFETSFSIFPQPHRAIQLVLSEDETEEIEQLIYRTMTGEE